MRGSEATPLRALSQLLPLWPAHRPNQAEAEMKRGSVCTQCSGRPVSLAGLSSPVPCREAERCFSFFICDEIQLAHKHLFWLDEKQNKIEPRQ